MTELLRAISRLERRIDRLAAIDVASVGGVTALSYNESTNERGLLIKFINRTGHASVKGELVTCSTTADREVVLQDNEWDTIAVVQQSLVAEGNEMWCWVNGSVCQVLAKDATAFTRGNVLIAADTDGRADNIANFGGGLPAAATHFKECGHVMESAAGGSDVLVLCCLHFN